MWEASPINGCNSCKIGFLKWMGELVRGTWRVMNWGICDFFFTCISEALTTRAPFQAGDIKHTLIPSNWMPGTSTPFREPNRSVLRVQMVQMCHLLFLRKFSYYPRQTNSNVRQTEYWISLFIQSKINSFRCTHCQKGGLFQDSGSSSPRSRPVAGKGSAQPAELWQLEVPILQLLHVHPWQFSVRHLHSQCIEYHKIHEYHKCGYYIQYNNI
jgi:hypothetical protein